ncbi:MAG: YeeE/YedE thiosulfate transporter family protein [Nitrospiraceae bacterium]|nr:YeeE/YedE thiosulfate transporter family protein [Nitrospiraceae bacterium]
MALGSILYRSDFCMAGVFRDVFLFRDYLRMKAFFLLVSLLAVILYLMRIFKVISTYPPSFFGVPSAANLLGGLLFGVGMVLGGGCLISTLYKLGAGSTASCITFCGVLLGGFVSAVFYPLIRSFASSTAFLKDKTSLEHIMGSAAAPVLLISLPAIALAWRWAKTGRWSQRAYARGYLSLWKASFMMAFVIAATVALSGRPLAVSTGFAKLSGFLGVLFLPVLTGKIAFFRVQSPRLLYGGIMNGGAGPVVDSVFLTQFPLMAGVVGGAFISSLRLGEFKVRRLPPARQAFSAFSGGVLMAAGALTAGGCNLWHMIGGLPVFALQSILFVFGAAGGAFLGSVFLRKVVIR